MSMLGVRRTAVFPAPQGRVSPPGVDDVTPDVRALLARALTLDAPLRGAVFDDLFDSLVGHDQLEPLIDELERRGDLVWEPNLEEIERRVREAEANPTALLDGEEVLAKLERELAERHVARPPEARPAPTPRATGAAGDLARAALALSPPERGALARAILETIERRDCADDGAPA